jgi:tRNA nucleotidyltransferase (CCA-adding enzyme)
LLFPYEVADQDVSARSTFEALAVKFMNLTLTEIALDVNKGVVERTAIPRCWQKHMTGKALVLMDPINAGWNLTAKVEQGKVARIRTEMRDHFERYLANPGEYWQSQERNCWPPRLALPTDEDRRMAVEAGSRVAA